MKSPICATALSLGWIVHCSIAGGLAAADPQPQFAFQVFSSRNSAQQREKAAYSTLAAARLKTTDEALLDFFRKRTPPGPPRDAVERLTKALGAKAKTDADAAEGELISL